MRIARTRAKNNQEQPQTAAKAETIPAKQIEPEPKAESGLTDYDAVVQRYKSKITNRASAIRSHCIDCMGGAVAEVARCTSRNCSLYGFRMGDNPFDKRTIAAKEKAEA